MAKVRQDAWTYEDDLLLAETVLRHIREGSTQLNAFEEVGDELNRTSAACGFRWNAEVRNKYVQAIDLAKRQRKERKRAVAKQTKQIVSPPSIINQTRDSHDLVLESELNLSTVIQYLQSLQYEMVNKDENQSKLDTLQSENERLRSEKDSLEKELAKLNNRLQTVEEDYTSFIQIMERARKLTLLEDHQGSLKSPTFRMDKNGNLEQINQN